MQRFRPSASVKMRTNGDFCRHLLTNQNSRVGRTPPWSFGCCGGRDGRRGNPAWRFPPGDVPGLRRHVKWRRSGNIVPSFFIKRLILCRFSPRLIGRWLLMLSLSKHGQVSEFAGAGDIPRGTMPVAGRGMAVGLGGRIAWRHLAGCRTRGHQPRHPARA